MESWNRGIVEFAMVSTMEFTMVFTMEPWFSQWFSQWFPNCVNSGFGILMFSVLTMNRGAGSWGGRPACACVVPHAAPLAAGAVSYTHLTLPTILLL
eukprot:7573737-Pyramimonas_sp.AAC.1